MIKAKTMTHWENENYDYPLPDVSHFSKKEAKKLKIRMSISTYPAAILVRRCLVAIVGSGLRCLYDVTGHNTPARNGSSFLYWGYTSVIFRFGRDRNPARRFTVSSR